MAGDMEGPSGHHPLESSSLSIYIGVPTQEFRKVQADIAGLVGQVLTVAHECEQGLPRNKYVPLLRGATSYVSVFGYWMGGGRSARRVDDHTEVIEFLFRPRELGVATTLVLTEVVFPALFCAQQREALVVIRHGGRQYQLSFVGMSELGEARSPSPDRIGPCEMVTRLVELCRYGRGGGPRSGLDRLASEDLCDLIVKSFAQWCTRRVPDAAGVEVGRFLPTVRHRFLAVTATWLLLHSLALADDLYASAAPRKSKVHALGPSEDVTPTRRTNNLIDLVELIDAELTSTVQEWSGWIASGNLHGDDPLANGLLWLAFIADYLEWYLGNTRLVDPEGARGEWQQYDRFGWIAAKVPGAAWPPVHLLGSSAPPQEWTFWLARLELLAGVNDRNFPDQPFLSTWELLARLLGKPWQLTDARENRRWAARTIAPSGATNLAWWAETLRLWNRAPVAARMWASPLVLDCIHHCLSNDSQFKENYRARYLDLSRLVDSAPDLEELQSAPDRRTSLDALQALLETARYGYPLASRHGDSRGLQAEN